MTVVHTCSYVDVSTDWLNWNKRKSCWKNESQWPLYGTVISSSSSGMRQCYHGFHLRNRADSSGSSCVCSKIHCWMPRIKWNEVLSCMTCSMPYMRWNYLCGPQLNSFSQHLLRVRLVYLQWKACLLITCWWYSRIHSLQKSSWDRAAFHGLDKQWPLCGVGRGGSFQDTQPQQPPQSRLELHLIRLIQARAGFEMNHPREIQKISATWLSI